MASPIADQHSGHGSRPAVRWSGTLKHAEKGIRHPKNSAVHPMAGIFHPKNLTPHCRKVRKDHSHRSRCRLGGSAKLADKCVANTWKQQRGGTQSQEQTELLYILIMFSPLNQQFEHNLRYKIRASRCFRLNNTRAWSGGPLLFTPWASTPGDLWGQCQRHFDHSFERERISAAMLKHLIVNHVNHK